jgi:hypothetical protein
LLPSLKEDTRESTEEDLVGAHLEAVDVSGLSHFLLHAQVGFDILELSLNTGVISGYTEQARERSSSAGVIVSLNEVSGGFGKEEHADDENARPDELEGDWNTIRPVVVAVLGALVDTSSEEETDGLIKVIRLEK